MRQAILHENVRTGVKKEIKNRTEKKIIEQLECKWGDTVNVYYGDNDPCSIFL